MFKNMKLGMKIGVGFSTLILIACLLGTLAVYNMKRVETESNKLANEYVPEVALASKVQENALLTMYEMRGYSLTEEQRYLQNGMKNLQEVENFLAECQKLADSSRNLVKLKDQVKVCKDGISKYKSLAEKTVECNTLIAKCRDELDKNAAAYMNNCNDF